MLIPSKYYHVYNRANGSEQLFIEERNFPFFLKSWKRYINPIASTHAWCLMPNHFHFLIKVKDEGELLAYIEGLENLQGLANAKAKQDRDLQGLANSKARQDRDLQGLANAKARQDLEGLIPKFLSQQFSNLLNSYTKSFNKIYKRKGSLFIPNFKHKEIRSEDYLKRIILYIHNNPVHHGFRRKASDWKYSSIHQYAENADENTLEMIELFGSKTDFITHQQNYRSRKQAIRTGLNYHPKYRRAQT